MDIERELANWTSQHQVGGSDILSKAYDWKLYETVEATGLYPYFRALEQNLGPTATLQGNDVVMLGSNNYLGLTAHPDVQEATKVAVERYGTGMTGSRLLNGTLELHEELESELAEFLGFESALVFTTGYQANLGILTALVNKHSAAVVDRKVHASIHDGCRMSDGATFRFDHNDPSDLARVLSSVPEGVGTLTMVDGVYSMEGNLAQLPGIADVVREMGSRLCVDDAHGLGVLGPGGRGTAHHFGLEDQVDLLVGTFSKSLASTGGFVAGDKKVIDFIKLFGRPMIFSASLAPACTASALAALRVLKAEPERVVTARENAQILYRELTALGFDTEEPEAAIVPIVVGDSMKTFMMWNALIQEGVYTNPVFYPAVGKGREMLRTSCMATHTEEHLGRAIDAFKRVGQSLELIAA